ncbi:MAG: ABC transporter permease [Candidatus Promineifilaceae bacterium]|nr:ABC transporter permease [Candidatus Promineifilaceae bacterium]
MSPLVDDIKTMIWKESKELIASSGGLRRGRLTLLVMVVILGVVLPFDQGRQWIESPLSLAVWVWVPMLLVATAVADAIAGERERRTLETLLASRMSDEAILLGKIAAVMLYAWVLVMAGFILGVVTVNVVHGEGGLLFYAPEIALGAVLGSLLSSFVVATAGVLVSLRAPTARQAQQILSTAMIVIIFVPLFGVQFLPPAWQERLLTMVTAASVSQLVLGLLVVLLIIGLTLLAMARQRFQRAKLILD